MTAHRWLGVSLAIGVAAAAFTSCKSGGGASSTSTHGSGSSSTGTGGTGGTGGARGTGGAAGTGGAVDAGPIVCTAAYTNVPKGAGCDLLQQDCGAGQTCVPDKTGTATTCIPATGLKSAGEDCFEDTECDVKLVCIGQTGDQPGQCVPFCCPAKPYEPCGGGICNEKVDFGGQAWAYMCSYATPCTLLAAPSCMTGYGCYVESTEGTSVAVCLERSANMIPELGVCSYINDCASMQDCYGLGSSTTGVCLYYCTIGAAGVAPGLGGCPTGQTCQSTYQNNPVNTGFPGVGLCIPTGGIMVDGG